MSTDTTMPAIPPTISPRRTDAALRSAIAKWKLMAHADTDVAEIARDIECPLCALFNPRDGESDSDCVGCPIYQSTKERYCYGTPYEQWADAEDSDEPAEVLQEAAEAEVEFLESLLLPKDAP